MFALLGLILVAFLVLPQSPLPRAWNPTTPLVIADPVTPITAFKFRRALASPERCLAALSLPALPDREDSANCGIAARVEVSQLAGLDVPRLETACPTALRLAMWVEHGLKPAAATHLGQELVGVAHAGSYNCRTMRTAAGASSRWSSHARAASVDITAVRLASGERLRLLRNWDGETPSAAFWNEARDSACRWFGLVLGPDYNALHADHFHLQNRGWGLCR